MQDQNIFFFMEERQTDMLIVIEIITVPLHLLLVGTQCFKFCNAEEFCLLSLSILALHENVFLVLYNTLVNCVF